ncbi:MAG: hypothetical protein RL064_1489 [Bacteroidota bacterium]|jgi:hypothetical protein
MEHAILKQKLEDIGWIFYFNTMTKTELSVAEKMLSYTNKYLSIREQIALFTAIYYNEIGLLPRIVNAIENDEISSINRKEILTYCLEEMPKYNFMAEFNS